ncbi:MAG: hypothetical protein O3C04_03585 [Crenarchaeota archaeon]|nr:hypothetical protein [Thermoproteota archaeon]
MTKIPVKIIEFLDGDKKIQEVMIDLVDTMQMDGDPEKRIEQFRDKYFDLVKQAQDIMPKKKLKRKPSHFWQIGKLLYDFNKSIKNDFEITNFQQAIIRDFGLYNRSVVGHVIQFGEFFNKKDVIDTISMSHYIELIWKANLLKKMGKLDEEKKRLLQRAANKTLSPHKEYREELNLLIKLKKKSSILNR